jgi:hypothetical protein
MEREVEIIGGGRMAEPAATTFGWAVFFFFFPFFQIERVKSGFNRGFCKYLFFLFQVDMSTSYWMAQRSWFMLRSYRSSSFSINIYEISVFMA